MSEELKACPRCGSEVMIVIENEPLSFGTNMWYSCSNSDCVFHHINLLPEDWQTRCFEDALQDAYDMMKNTRDSVKLERDALRKKLDDVKNNNQGLWDITQTQQRVINRLHKQLEIAIDYIQWDANRICITKAIRIRRSMAKLTLAEIEKIKGE